MKNINTQKTTEKNFQKNKFDFSNIKNYFSALLLGATISLGNPQAKAEIKENVPVKINKKSQKNIEQMTQIERINTMGYFISDVGELSRQDFENKEEQKANDFLKEIIGFKSFEENINKFYDNPKEIIYDIDLKNVSIPKEYSDILNQKYKKLHIRKKLIKLLKIHKINIDSKENLKYEIIKLLSKDEKNLSEAEKQKLLISYFYLIKELFLNNIALVFDEKDRKDFKNTLFSDDGMTFDEFLEKKGIFYLDTNNKSVIQIFQLETKDFIPEKYLPNDKYTREIMKEYNFKDTKKVYFLSGNQGKNTNFNAYANPRSDGNIVIYIDNVEKEFGSKKEKKNQEFIEAMTKNEVMHTFLNTIGFTGKETSDLFPGNSDYTNDYVHEVLSDYNSLTTKSEVEYKRIIRNIFSREINKITGDNILNTYFLTNKIHGEIIEKFLGKKLENFLEEEAENDKELKDFLIKVKILSQKNRSTEEEKEYTKLGLLYENKLRHQLTEKLYQTLATKTINYNGKEISGLDYMLERNQEVGRELMEKVYDWYKKQKN